MSSKIFFFVFLLIIIVVIVLKTCTRLNQSETLVMVHAIFRHGDRTPIAGIHYPNDPYKNEKYLPYGIGGLTERGKQRQYDLGKMLRQRYNQLLGESYKPKVIYARTTGDNRTEMSLRFVLESLFSLKKRKNYRISYEMVPVKSDKLLSSFGACPNYTKLFMEASKSETAQAMGRNYTDVFNYIAKYSGWNKTDFHLALLLYTTLKSEMECGLKLPEWTNKIYPDVLKKIAATTFYLGSSTTNLKQLGIGFLLHKIINDTQAKIAGHTDTKLFLYSGYDITVVTILNTLGVFKPHTPPYGSCVLLEVHKINSQYGIKVFYENYEGVQTGLLTIPGCDQFCPFDKFVSLMKKYLPDENLCGSK